MMGGVMAIAAGVFGVLWTVIAAGMGGGLFALFGLVFIAVAVIQAVYNFRNATGENRYSVYDITDNGEEPDPLNTRFGGASETTDRQSCEDGESLFCPYCGAKAGEGYAFCRKCGKRLP